MGGIKKGKERGHKKRQRVWARKEARGLGMERGNRRGHKKREGVEA